MMQPDKIVQCPICLETMSKPIIQCANGHSMDEICIRSNNITKCPQCRGPITNIRCYQLEQLIESFNKNVVLIPCFFAQKGCKTMLTMKDQEGHEQECKFRIFPCEGRNFAGWKCGWNGDISDLYKHFKDQHKNNTWMQYSTKANLKIDFKVDHKDIQIISFFNGQNYFYYKHKVDVTKQKAYWTFQLVGPKDMAKTFYYEFEVHNGPIRKFKVTEFCDSNSVKTEEIFNSEKCVVMSFATVKSFLDDKEELPFSFRIMTVKKQTTAKSTKERNT